MIYVIIKSGKEIGRAGFLTPLRLGSQPQLPGKSRIAGTVWKIEHHKDLDEVHAHVR